MQCPTHPCPDLIRKYIAYRSASATFFLLEKDSGKTRIRKDITAKSPTQTTILSYEAPAISVLDKGLFTYRCMNLGVGLGYAVLGQG